MKDPDAPCKNCKHLGESAFDNEGRPVCLYCKKPDYLYWEEVEQ